MKEIEIKVLKIDKTSIIKELLSLGAKKVFEGDMEALYLDFPDQRLKKNGSLLRLRLEGDTNIIAFKSRRKSSFAKSAIELEIETDDYAKTIEILKGIGLEIQGDVYRKKRTSFALGKVHFEFDEPDYKGIPIPCYLEIEAHHEKDLKKYLALLKIPESDAKDWTGKQVLEYYEDKNLKKNMSKQKK
jgi:adenylate cyclase, class 2